MEEKEDIIKKEKVDMKVEVLMEEKVVIEVKEDLGVIKLKVQPKIKR